MTTTPSILLDLLDQAFDHRAWHGTNLRGSIRGLTARQARWRAGPRRHSIAEIVLHAAYWKYAVRRRLTGEKRGSFALTGSNWFPVDDSLSDDDWRRSVALLVKEHRLLRQAVSVLRAPDLPRKPPGGKVSRLYMIQGIALHDVYHAGQIQSIKGLMKQ